MPDEDLPTLGALGDLRELGELLLVIERVEFGMTQTFDGGVVGAVTAVIRTDGLGEGEDAPCVFHHSIQEVGVPRMGGVRQLDAVGNVDDAGTLFLEGSGTDVGTSVAEVVGRLHHGDVGHELAEQLVAVRCVGDALLLQKLLGGQHLRGVAV